MSAGHLQLAHHDPHDGLQDLHRFHRRMHLPRDLQQCLQAGNLLLQVNDVSVAGKGEELGNDEVDIRLPRAFSGFRG